MAKKIVVGVVLALVLVAGWLYIRQYDAVVRIRVKGLSRVTFKWELADPGPQTWGRPFRSELTLPRPAATTFSVPNESFDLPIPVATNAVYLEIIGERSGDARPSCEIWQDGVLRAKGETDGKQIVCGAYILRATDQP